MGYEHGLQGVAHADCVNRGDRRTTIRIPVATYLAYVLITRLLGYLYPRCSASAIRKLPHLLSKTQCWEKV